MISPFRLRGYVGPDPLDELPTAGRYALGVSTAAALTAVMVLLITRVFDLVQFLSTGLEITEVVAFGLIYGTLVMAFRKSSSLLHYALVLLPLFAWDLWLEAHVRMNHQRATWMYTPATFIDRIQPAPLRFFLTLSVDGVVVGPISLWLSRLLAQALRSGRPPSPENAPAQLPFPLEWTDETEPKPRRSPEFWILRLLGLGYLGYLLILLLGALGPGAWPPSVAKLFTMTYANPYLAVNTFSKISLMVGLTAIGAYSVGLRWTTTLAAAVGHLASVASCLFFYYYGPRAEEPQFLLISAIVDGAMVLLFCWILARSWKDSVHRSGQTLPSSFSLPTMIWRYTLVGLAVYAFATVVVSLVGRLGHLPSVAWEALFSYPDPTLGNSLTLYSTMVVLFAMMSRNREIRDALTSVLRFSLGMGVAASLIVLAIGARCVRWPAHPSIDVQLLLVLHAVELAAVIGVLTALESLYYNVEYTITTFRASSARAIVALHKALFPGDEDSDVLQAIDRYSGTIHGRKRGLINFPFWLFDNVFPQLFALKPAFSTMAADERLYFLRRSLIRPEDERRRAFVPELAEVAYELAVAAQSLVLFGAYAGRARQEAIGYVAPGARDRLQGLGAPDPPPLREIPPLPQSPADPKNWPPPTPPRKIPAPRVSTPTEQGKLPDSVDFLVIGSGPGGAVAAYRLACGAKAGTTIAVLDRGPRISPLQDMTERELEMYAKLYKEGGLQQTKRADMIVLQGECVGGGSVINNAVCYQIPDSVESRWQRDYDLNLFSLPKEYQRVAGELLIAPLPNPGINEKAKSLFVRAVDAYNDGGPQNRLEKPSVVEVNAPGAFGDGLWNIGNKYLAKRTVLETYIPWSEARGVQFVPNCTAARMFRSGKRVDSVLVHTVNGDLRRVIVNKALIVAGGVIASSHFLMRSGVRLPVGQKMSCNFAFPVAFDFPTQVDAFDGEQITLGARDPKGRAIFETYFNPPGAFALTVPFFFKRHEEAMKRYRNLLVFGALVGSEPNGTLSLRADLLNGQAFDWKLGEADQANIRYALGVLLQLGAEAGASRAIVPTRPGVELPLNADNIREFNRVLGNRPLRLRDLLMSTAHPQGGNLMAGDQSGQSTSRVVDGQFRVVGFDNLYVVDASVFPTSLTVNPQWTIMAMSSLASSQILASHP